MSDKDERNPAMILSRDEVQKGLQDLAKKREQEGNVAGSEEYKKRAELAEDERKLDTETKEIRDELDRRIKDFFEWIKNNQPQYTMQNVSAVRENVLQNLKMPHDPFGYSVDKSDKRKIDISHVVSTMSTHEVRMPDGMHKVGIQYVVHRGTEQGYYFLLFPVHDWGVVAQEKLSPEEEEEKRISTIKKDLMKYMEVDGRLSHKDMESLERKYMKDFGENAGGLKDILRGVLLSVGDAQQDVVKQFMDFLDRDNAKQIDKKKKKGGIFGWWKRK